MEEQFKIQKARTKIRMILEKYQCNYFDVIDVEPIDRKFDIFNKLTNKYKFKMKKDKSVKIEIRTWSLLKNAKIKKKDGKWETFAETITRLLRK